MVNEYSRKVAASALKIALTESREEEEQLKKNLHKEGIYSAAVNYGGESSTAVSKIIERAVVAAKREGVISDTHAHEGAVAGATHDAMIQIMSKAMGLNIGGKIGIARKYDHISVALWFGVGMIHLNEVAVGLAHRAISSESGY